MKIVMLSNFINHHQSPVADELYAMEDVEYWFIETRDMPEAQKRLGYPVLTGRPYVVQSYKSEYLYKYALQLIKDADVVIVGSAPEEMITKRLEDNKLTFRYAERWLKELDWHLLDPRLWKLLYDRHLKYRKKNLYMLAASAYLPNDAYLLHTYKDKIYKWGYFPAVKPLEVIREKSSDTTVKIMWCGRFLNWKHPELPVLLAKILKNDGYSFQLNMFGGGLIYDKIVNLAEENGLFDVVHFKGNTPNEEIISQMKQHDIYLFTSNKFEGWGAVLNESMSQGCAVVASNMIGSAPFLIEDGKNGLLFNSGDVKSLYSKVKQLLDDERLRSTLSKNAVDTMQNMWSPPNAAQRFVTLATRLLNNQDTEFTDGPCSKAYPYKG